MFKLSQLKSYFFSGNTVLLVVLLAFVLLVNLPVIHFDMMYVEQPSIYLVNQTIHSLRDMANVYLHPALLDNAIPFFRPSGHFLVYQLVTPLLGWHNTKGLLLINLFFLASIGYVMIKLYQLLFPGFRAGGCLAFGVYLMQPALSLSRLTLMHFEFAYVLFLLMSLYCFALFCKKNYLLESSAFYSCETKKIKFHHLYLIFLTALFYVIAATFKESAVMLGPVLVCYLCIALYHRQPLMSFVGGLFQNKELFQIVSLLMITCIVLAMYLTLPWPGFVNPAHRPTKMIELVGSMSRYARIFFATSENVAVDHGLYAPGMTLRRVVVPIVTHLIMWFLLVLSFASVICLWRDRASKMAYLYRKSLVFLFVAFLLFLILPIGWAAGMPWHVSLSLLCLSMVMGFSFEYVAQLFFENKSVVLIASVMGAVLIGLTTITVNKANIQYLLQTPEGFAYQLNRNAVLNPPNIKSLLNADSLLVVEDSLHLGDYALGNGGFPFYLIDGFNYSDFQKKQSNHFLKYQVRYNGTLFRWAYLMPNLQEELSPFQIDNMKMLPDEAIYSWLIHDKNIFCVGYDKEGAWYDRTELFKKKLLAEQKRRNLQVSQYRSLVKTAMLGKRLYVKLLPVPDDQLCQFQCDQDSRCKGFLYMDAGNVDKFQPRCDFYRSFDVKTSQPCSACAVHIKANTV